MADLNGFALSAGRGQSVREALPEGFVRSGGALALCLLCALAGARPALAVEEIPQYRTRQQSGCHTSGIYPATRRIQNLATGSGFSVDVCPGTTTVFHAPLVILNSGFKVQAGANFVAGHPIFPVHMTVIAPAASAIDTRAELEAILATMNDQFLSEQGERLTTFWLRSFTTWQAIDAANLEAGGVNEDPCVAYVQTSGDAFSSGSFNTLFGTVLGGSCSFGPTVIRDPEALNVYIYDVAGNSGHGRRNSGYPWNILDIDRIANPNLLTRQAPEAHEMGHCFGCAHVYDDDVSARAQDSNLMGSSSCGAGGTSTYCSDTFTCPVSGGNRLAGLAHEAYPECVASGCGTATICQAYQNAGQPRLGQTQLVLWYAEEFARNFGMPHSWSATLPIRLPCGDVVCSHFPP